MTSQISLSDYRRSLVQETQTVISGSEPFKSHEDPSCWAAGLQQLHSTVPLNRPIS